MNNVLIIEDDKEICVMIKDHLEKYNYQVFFTLTGANAIERIKECFSISWFERYRKEKSKRFLFGYAAETSSRNRFAWES